LLLLKVHSSLRCALDTGGAQVSFASGMAQTPFSAEHYFFVLLFPS